MPRGSNIDVEQALQSLGAVLLHRGRHHELVLIGGSALLLVKLGRRATQDVDVVARIEKEELVRATPLPVDLRDAALDVAKAHGIGEDWLNAGPTDILKFGLPEGFLSRCAVLEFGGLTLRIASRFDQIHFKLFAAVDQGMRSKHAHDLKQLEPTRVELDKAAQWCRTQDPSDGFALMLTEMLEQFGAKEWNDHA